MDTDEILGAQSYPSGATAWDNPANWSLGVLPQAGDAVLVKEPTNVFEGQAVDTEATDPPYVISSLTVESNYEEELSLEIANSLTVSGSTALESASLSVDSGGIVHLDGPVTLSATDGAYADGNIENEGGTLILGAVSASGNYGSISALGGYTSVDDVTGNMEVAVDGGTLALSAASGVSIVLGPGLLVLSPASPTLLDRIVDNADTVEIDLATVPFQQGETAHLQVVNDSPYDIQQSVTIQTTGDASIVELTDVEVASAMYYVKPIQAATVADDGAGGTLLTLLACYCPGTLILTLSGEIPVEDLRIGNTVVTASGEHRPIKWIGRRSYAGRFLAANPNVQPIRLSAGCLGDGVPRRDLLVSPEHAMFLDGVLIPARCLVNRGTIVQERGLERVDYFHVELDTHDVLLAEGAPSESYLDDDSRGMFHNAHEFAVLYPDAPRPDGFCARRVEQGAELEAIRRRLAGVAGKIARAA